MVQSSLLRSLVLAAAIVHCTIAKYTLVSHFHPGNFFENFEFFTEPDPTSGVVTYVDEAYAKEYKLIRGHKNSVKIGVDHTSVLNVGQGRPSVRLQSYATYTTGLFILSLDHMPYACGAWPAFWTLGPNWPTGGEIDIIEGVNRNTYNIATLHTGPGCTIAGERQTGTMLTNNCTSTPSQNQGCGIAAEKSRTYGSAFNKAGGGVYVMEWTNERIRTWFFGHKNVPKSIHKGDPKPHEFGEPFANFAGSCNIAESFSDHQIIFDTTFCGDYAGNTYYLSGCPGASGGYAACEAFVAQHPRAFRNAYWSINWLKVYQNTDPAGRVVADGKKEKPKKSWSSVKPAAATSPILSHSLKYAGMGVPASVTEHPKKNIQTAHPTWSLPEPQPTWN